MANLMDLVRELKALNARKKSGEVLGPDEETRRKELKNYLKSALEAQQGAGPAISMEDTAVKDAPSRRSASSAASMSSVPPRSAESSAPKPSPLTGRTSTSGAAIASPRGSPAAVSMGPGARPVVESLDPPAVLDPPAPAAPKPFVPKKDAYAIKGVDNLLHAAAGQMDGDSVDGGAKFVVDDIPLEDGPPEEEAPASGGPKAFVPKKDFYAIKDADSILTAAAKSEAVARVDPRKAHASAAELAEAEERAEQALRATKLRERPKNADEAIEQLQQIESQYTPPEEDYALEQYYGVYAEDGYEFVDERAVALPPIDSRDLELHKATGALAATAAPAPGAPAMMTAPPGLVFLDDFAALYQKRVLPSPDEEVVVDIDDPNLLIPGKRKVTVHMLNGERKTGAIRLMRRGDLGFRLEPQGSGMPEEISLAQCKAVFIHLQPNAQPRPVQGHPLTVTFKDRREVQGQSDDYQPGSPVFTLVPPAGRGQFERIIVNVAAVLGVR